MGERMEKVFAIAAGLIVGAGTCFAAAPMPEGIQRLLPGGYDVMSSAGGVAMGGGGTATVVVLARSDEADLKAKGESPARPLLVFAKGRDESFRLLARNDVVVMHIDDGGQCDPFLDGGGEIAVRQTYFTVQNGVACGAHWTDYVTFRFDTKRGAFVFDNEVKESWHLNSSRDPNAEAMVRDGPRRVRRADAQRVVLLQDWRWRR